VSDGVRAGVWGSAREALLDALALVLPTECAGCGTEGRELCTACRGRLASALVRAASPGGIRVYAGASYDELVRRVVLACKQGRTGLANPLAGLLAVALEAALAEVALAGALTEAGAAEPRVELCAVPSTRAAYRRRGFDPARLVLARTGQADAHVLRPARPHHVQKGLGRDERRTNLRGVHRARGRLDGRTFLLIDDVVTTGATIDEAARAIREAGGEVLAAVAIAATPLRGGRRHARTTPSETAG
jgi:predicted amidophosphoribosyltransferase